MTENDRPTVVIAIPHMGDVRTELVEKILMLAGDRRYNVLLGWSSQQPVANNRNHIARQFLESSADWLLMIDSDQYPTKNPLDLIGLDLDVVGFPTPMWKGLESPSDPIVWNFNIANTTGGPAGGSIAADRVAALPCHSIGTGMMLIKRRVLEHPAMRAPFLDEFDENGFRARGEDLAFCDRVRAAGFGIYVALDYPSDHLKTVSLLQIQQCITQKIKENVGDYVTPVKALEDKQLVFSISPGRCGTRYLAETLATIAEVDARHEPDPQFTATLRLAQYDAGAAYQFWLERKLPYIAKLPKTTYVETSHMFCEGYAEPLLNIGIIPDIIVITRDHREVALSKWRRGAVPGRTKKGELYNVQPDDPGVLLPVDASGWTDYQLCYWVCLEIAARANAYAPMFANRGARVATIDMAELVTRRGFKRLLKELDLPQPDWNAYHKIAGQHLNATRADHAGKWPDGDLDAQEAQVREVVQ